MTNQMSDYSEEGMIEKFRERFPNLAATFQETYQPLVACQEDEITDFFLSLFSSYRAAVRGEIEKLEPPYDTLEKDIDYDRGYQKAKEEILSSPLLAEDR